ncbi:hypothetical protein CHLRE_17g697750v5 [Chlamydomonas reinhardtii]|uniref:Uncharacterized protein n=1 Tax=Chlamydomonas reinhardtii TaxID=3055 RepID=A0A2K3CNP8_CHLRE|nr:uncharacterized protein CHLRE_17g697750v5 [Chlamydomonas reinhardtii]PNW69907.1 hypothetical protein CHLRE_17g697750v5 [Chlamydomonas reinhardtii]
MTRELTKEELSRLVVGPRVVDFGKVSMGSTNTLDTSLNVVLDLKPLEMLRESPSISQVIPPGARGAFPLVLQLLRPKPSWSPSCSQAQLWLVQAPPGFQQCVWDVVVMAALAATEHGRVRLRGMTRAAAALGTQTAAAAAPEAAVAGAVEAEPDLDEIPPTQLTPPQPGVNPVELACARAVADF